MLLLPLWCVCLCLPYLASDYLLLLPTRRHGMGLYNVIFIITSHVTDLLFSFLLPHFFSSIYAKPGSVSANSTVAIPGAFRVSDHLRAVAPSLGQG